MENEVLFQDVRDEIALSSLHSLNEWQLSFALKSIGLSAATSTTVLSPPHVLSEHHCDGGCARVILPFDSGPPSNFRPGIVA